LRQARLHHGFPPLICWLRIELKGRMPGNAFTCTAHGFVTGHTKIS
jgi:hypothetical protein